MRVLSSPHLTLSLSFYLQGPCVLVCVCVGRLGVLLQYIRHRVTWVPPVISNYKCLHQKTAVLIIYLPSIHVHTHSYKHIGKELKVIWRKIWWALHLCYNSKRYFTVTNNNNANDSNKSTQESRVTKSGETRWKMWVRAALTCKNTWKHFEFTRIVSCLEKIDPRRGNNQESWFA